MQVFAPLTRMLRNLGLDTRMIPKFGFDIVRFKPSRHPLARRRLLLAQSGVDLVLDVGANVGQYAEELRQLGYCGTIISFEPMKTAFSRLERRARRDRRWDALNIGLGDQEGTFKINVAANSWSSSIREMLPQHVVSAPHSKYVSQDEIVVRRLDSMMDELCPRSSTIFLKVDTQGFEMNVLRGAEKSLERIGLMQLEMSLVPLYRGEILFDEMSRYLMEKQYILVSLEPGFSDPKTGRLLQVDGVFSRVEPGSGTQRS